MKRLKKLINKCLLFCIVLHGISPYLLTQKIYSQQRIDERAPRPDAPAVTSPFAIVGPGTCDLTELELLIQKISGNLDECCAILEEDFRETWTILADLKATISTDFMQTWTILAAIQTGTTCQCLPEFQETWTILADLKATMSTDFMQTWTILAAIQASTTCQCEAEFQETWTILADLKSTVSVDFNQTWTILADLKATVSTDFMQTWTILAAIQASTTCQCEAEFQETWTILADLKSTVSVDFNQTWTILADLKATVSTDFMQTWTILAAIQASTTCQCEAEFQETWTILADLKSTVSVDFNQTWTILADLKATVSTDFMQTWTILAAISALECSPTLIRQSNFGPGGTTSYTISTSGVYLLAENITYNPAGSSQAIVITTSNVTLDLQCFTLQQGNSTADVDGIGINSGLTDIIIKNGKIENFTGSGISVQNNNKRITIKDLTCLNCAERGIELVGTSGNTITESLIENCNILNCCQGTTGDRALSLEYCYDTKIDNCRINENGATTHNLQVVRLDNCIKCSLNEIDANDNRASDEFRAFDLVTATECTFEKCSARNNTALGNSRGFLLESSTTCTANQFINCIVLLTTGSAAVDGFLTDTGCDDNLFIDCKSLLNASTGASTTAIVHGFNFINNARNYCINCLASGNNAPSSTATFGALGFDLNTTSSCSLVQCLAYDHITGVASSSVGIRVSNGTNNGIRECESSRQTIGYRVDPANTLNHVFIRNTSFKTTTPFDQFIAGSNDAAGNIANINALSFPWTNISVG